MLNLILPTTLLEKVSKPQIRFNFTDFFSPGKFNMVLTEIKDFRFTEFCLEKKFPKPYSPYTGSSFFFFSETKNALTIS